MIKLSAYDKLYRHNFDWVLSRIEPDTLKFYGDKETTDRIWDEINFCRTMKELRTPSYLKDEDTPVLKRTINN